MHHYLPSFDERAALVKAASSMAVGMGRYPHRYLILQYNSKTAPIFDSLREWGFFDLHTSNKGYLISLHQIICFLNCGGIGAMRRGEEAAEGEIEIHHIDGNTNNNSPENLVYLTTAMHKLITAHQRYLCKYIRKMMKKDLIVNAVQGARIWNKRGKLVKDTLSFFIRILAHTMHKSARFFLGDKLASIKGWLKQVRHNLSLNLTSFIHCPQLLALVKGEIGREYEYTTSHCF